MKCNRKFNTIQVFEDRLFLATGGALHNINLSKYGAAISGSILIPCICYNELEEKFINVRFDTSRSHTDMISSININNNSKKGLYNHLGNMYELNESDKNFMSYLEYYYPSYYSLKDCDYIKKVISENICNLSEKKPAVFKLEKELHNPDKLEEKEKDDDESNKIKENEKKDQYNLLSDIDISITCDNYDSFEKLAKKLATEIIKNCRSIGKVWLKKIYTTSTFKFKLYGPGLIRPIDLFRISYGPEKMVKKFHCPIVRSWYDGTNTPSFKIDQLNSECIIFKNIDDDLIEYESDDFVNEITFNTTNTNNSNNRKTINMHYTGYNSLLSCVMTTLSGINNNYKWFFNSKPCIEVILKYAQRGYSTVINNKEKEALLLYMKTSDRWNTYISDDIDIFGQVSKDHIFFHPCINNTGIRFNLRKFKLMETSIYSKTTHVGLFKSITEYKVNLNIKTNNQLNIPDLNKFNSFKDYVEENNDDEFSDADEL
jgi:hypothetical protein